MKYLAWLLRLLLFLVLLGFAVKNSGLVTLRFFFDAAWQLPLVAILLLFFAAGALAGLSAALGAWLRLRRELARLRQGLPGRSPPQ
ncbi:MAG TPA: lipopolysaccharide assembly protein LapA domain-containing protein [Candidatus Desulfobacillus sp.]|nr:lipopolysaccharide assembly protein LapA domain-containing protein [Candidatus Desulfobacillus sp.]